MYIVHSSSLPHSNEVTLSTVTESLTQGVSIIKRYAAFDVPMQVEL